LLIDNFGRVHRNLRISVTDRCNIRCFYCMPAGDVAFAPRTALLTFEEITRVVRILVAQGITGLRLTGGEPLVRKDIPRLVAMLAAIDGVNDLAMTTNGILLPGLAEQLRKAGLRRLNISLDTVDEETFRKITRREGVDRVLRGIDAAIDAGFDSIRLNALAIRGLTESQIESLIRFAAPRGLTMRFIEFMPLDADQAWRDDKVLGGDELLARVESQFGRVVPIDPPRPSQPSRDYELADQPLNRDGKRPRVGIIRPVSAPFCGDCDRLRLTAEGMIRNCLFSQEEWDARALLRSGATDDDLLEQFRVAVANKRAGHQIQSPGFLPPERPMFQIGG